MQELYGEEDMEKPMKELYEEVCMPYRSCMRRRT